MPPEVVTAAPNEGPKGDVAMDMIRDGLAERDRLRSERQEQSATEESVETTETVTAEETPEAEPTPTKETSEPEPPAPDLQSVLAENQRLKEENQRNLRALGKQGNEMGPLKAKLSELGEILDRVSAPEKPQDPRDVAIAELKEVFGEEIAGHLIRTVSVLTADLRGNTVLGEFRKQIPDFQEYEPEMAKILSEDADLQKAVASNPAILKTVYRAARASRLEADGKSAENKGAALERQIAADKKAAFVERPGGNQNKEPVKMSVAETGQKVLDDILSASQDGRRR